MVAVKRAVFQSIASMQVLIVIFRDVVLIISLLQQGPSSIYHPYCCAPGEESVCQREESARADVGTNRHWSRYHPNSALSL